MAQPAQSAEPFSFFFLFFVDEIDERSSNATLHKGHLPVGDKQLTMVQHFQLRSAAPLSHSSTSPPLRLCIAHVIQKSQIITSFILFGGCFFWFFCSYCGGTKSAIVSAEVNRCSRKRGLQALIRSVQADKVQSEGPPAGASSHRTC